MKRGQVTRLMSPDEPAVGKSWDCRRNPYSGLSVRNSKPFLREVPLNHLAERVLTLRVRVQAELLVVRPVDVEQSCNLDLSDGGCRPDGRLKRSSAVSSNTKSREQKLLESGGTIARATVLEAREKWQSETPGLWT